jgi:uroporphyrinogen-III synthase
MLKVTVVFYRMVSNDITEVMQANYDMIVFFSPFSVQDII